MAVVAVPIHAMAVLVHVMAVPIHVMAELDPAIGNARHTAPLGS
jgi:hypothetical protein